MRISGDPSPLGRRTRTGVFLLFSALLLSSIDAQQEITLRELETDYASMYPGITAAEGLLIPGNGVEINCMHAPQPLGTNHSSPLDNICRIPNWLSTLNVSKKEELRNSDTHPICFVVSGNESECTLLEQVRVTQRIQDSVNDRVKCLVVYGNNPDIFGLRIRDYAVAVIYIPQLAGLDLLDRMDQFANRSNRSSFFHDLSGENVDWKFAFQVQPFGGSGRYYDRSVDNFFWFRIILFTLLIISPCLRAAYLWYAGGGRLHLRRDDDGRIVGLQVVPPMPHWLSSGVIIRPTEPVSTVLTDEQFNSLPTMTYQSGAKSESHESRSDGLDLSTDGDGEKSEVPMQGTGSAPDIEEAEGSGSALANDQATATSTGDGETDSPMTPSCTLCSICIEDFEAGESLLILPRCKHAFHRDCIHPWLTERQGCCPLCKTNVFEQSDSSSDDRSGNDETTEATSRDASVDISTNNMHSVRT